MAPRSGLLAHGGTEANFSAELKPRAIILLYAVAGESGIAIAEVHFDR